MDRKQHGMKAMVLCAGFGTRLGALSKETPKPLIPLNGQPLLGYTLRYLAQQGFREVLINLHFRPEKIIEYVGDGSKFGVTVQYSHEQVLLGTAGAIKKAQCFFSDVSDFLVLYGDLLIDQDLSGMMEMHLQKKATATLLVHKRASSNSVVRMSSDFQIIDFIERPSHLPLSNAPDVWVNSGLYILNSRVLRHIPEGQDVDFPRDIFSMVFDTERLFGYPLTGYRCAIDSLERYEEAQAAIQDGRYRGKWEEEMCGE